MVDDNCQELVQLRKSATPYIISFNMDIEDKEVDTFYEALSASIGLYYVFDSEYPHACMGTLLF